MRLFFCLIRFWSFLNGRSTFTWTFVFRLNRMRACGAGSRRMRRTARERSGPARSSPTRPQYHITRFLPRELYAVANRTRTILILGWKCSMWIHCRYLVAGKPEVSSQLYRVLFIISPPTIPNRKLSSPGLYHVVQRSKTSGVLIGSIREAAKKNPF